MVAALVIGLIATAAGGIAFATGAFDATENDSVDARFSIRGEHAVPDLAFVAVDDRTFRRPKDGGLGLQWPFPRSIHAQLIDRLRARRGQGDRLRRPVHRADEPATRTTP